MKRLLLTQLILLALATGMWAQGYFGREKPTGPPEVKAMSADEQTSLTNAQNALTTAAQNLAAVKQAILKAHGDATPCSPSAATCTRAIIRPDGFIETVTYSQSPRPTPAATAAAKPVAH